MIILNLISPEQKKILRIKQLFLLLRNLFGLILFFTIIIAIALILTNYSLSLSYEYNQPTLNNIAFSEKEVQGINNKLKNVFTVQNQHTYWPPILIDLFNLVPNGVEINNLTIDKNTQVVKIGGLAKNRNDYLQLITSLQNNQQVKDLNSPLENLLSKEDIDFNLTFIYQLVPN